MSTPQSAMVLAAGLGSRLAPLTDHCPKPLLEMGGRSLLARALDELCKTTVTQVVINIHHLGSQIETYLETQAPWPFSITLSREPVLLETAGGIINALPALTSPFYVLAGDVLCDLPLKTLSLPTGATAQLAMVPNPPWHPTGDFCLDRTGQLTRDLGPRLTYSGTGLFSKAFFDGIDPGPRPLRPLFEQALDAGTLHGLRHDGLWDNVGTPETLAAARARFS